MQPGNSEEVRRDQIAHGRTLSLAEGKRDGASRPHSGSKPFKKFTPKGHDAILAKLQETNQAVDFTIAGESFPGRIIGRDKFTITAQPLHREGLDSAWVDSSNSEPVTFYKHAIESFQPMKGVFVRPA